MVHGREGMAGGDHVSSSPSSSSSGSSLSSPLVLLRGASCLIFFAGGGGLLSFRASDFRFDPAPRELVKAPLAGVSLPCLSASSSPSSPPLLPSSIAATSSAVKNLPPGPRGLRIACLCLDSCRYGFRPLDVRRSASSSLCRATRLFSMRWNCFALTYSGASSAPLAAISGEGGCCGGCWGGGGICGGTELRGG